MTQATIEQGIHGSGGRLYDWRELNAVKSTLLTTEIRRPLTVAQIDDLTHIPGRTVRQIVSDLDAIEFMLGGTRGYFVAEYLEDTESLTRALQSQYDSMGRRLERRRRFALYLPHRQGMLW